jgi:hypothetical protein
MVSHEGYSGPMFDFDPWPDRSLTDVPNAPLGQFWGHSGKWENEDILPRRLVNRNKNKTEEKKLPHFFMAAGRWCVDDVFRSAVESLEPGQHQFVPLTMEDKNGRVLQCQCYLFNTIGWHDAAKSIPARNPVPPFALTAPAITRALIPSAHCWRDHYSTTHLLMSAELVSRLKAAGVRNLRLTELEEV